ncbi:MAG TPA: D-alanyl-D-alanine carboxypeptidase/D-alanyl-D-alanine-endopeptidase [Gaiellaceae bacterium]|nr:D-alanyl-D-alanine carboxypeptidase/D-alanyl-D-alanine-endopeptidase [Gaiellaceae bacterium]
MSTTDYGSWPRRRHGPDGPSSRHLRPISWKRAFVTLTAAFVTLAAASPATGTLKTRLDRALRAQGVSSSHTGAIVFDLSKNSYVYRKNSALSLKPASNEKLPVAVTALSILGPGYTIPTELRGQGHQTGTVWDGKLILKGYGDPALSGSQLGRFARSVENLGITRVTGAIVGDESFFDKLRVGPGWKSSYYKDECPPLSALIVNRAHFKGYITGRPALAAAKMLRAKLVDRGIKVGGRARLGRADSSSTVIATEQSPALRWLVRTMDRQSDNFYAEMLTKLVGALEADEGTTSAGTKVIRRELRSRDVPMRGVVLSDGSGLSAYDRLTATAVARLLRSAFADSDISQVFVDSLPVAGVNGTLFDRMTSGPAYRNVYAKTGTTDSASALSGYVRSRYVFSILMNGSPIPWWYARQAQDRFAQVLAGQ